ncbi:hypothetical protein GXM_01374 [Nostoc sphaeroides CCNUC1]|uniref:Uncharacterized protein n=1 Tax=Nostoc sphaeroides CCNUC1 TaxID=2653204 RepID=A0A5P8VUA9_9NOSO|nr:hypothetical protein GXM_01374 [Nostoc sphaeroides CCNUC1]
MASLLNWAFAIRDRHRKGRVRHRTAPPTVALPFLISLVQMPNFCQSDTALRKFIFLRNITLNITLL